MGRPCVADRAAARGVARLEGILLAVPLLTLYPGEERPSENKLQIVGPTDEMGQEYLKYGGSFTEGARPGDRRLRMVKAPFGLLSGVLCWDMGFPAAIRQGGLAGVGQIVLRSNYWAEVTTVHR